MGENQHYLNGVEKALVSYDHSNVPNADYYESSHKGVPGETAMFNKSVEGTVSISIVPSS